MSDVELAGLPMPLRWLHEPAGWSVADDGTLTIVASPRTDWFVDPQGDGEPVVNAPALVGEQKDDFLLSARVSVEFGESFDAGVLVLYADDRTWAKLCFEYSPQGRPMVVSVVTRDVSDDCNSAVVEGHEVWLRIARLGPGFAFHASTDGSAWDLVRHFALEPADELSVGFEAQSPVGPGCTASFAEISFAAGRLGDLRSGE